MGLVIDLDGEIWFYLKGADSIMKDRIKITYEPIILEETESLSREGLRTLVLAYKKLDPAYYKAWNEKYKNDCSALVDKELRTGASIAELERDMEFAGITAVEDKLQHGVYSCIEILKSAGIKIWMLTGDKLETA